MALLLCRLHGLYQFGQWHQQMHKKPLRPLKMWAPIVILATFTTNTATTTNGNCDGTSNSNSNSNSHSHSNSNSGSGSRHRMEGCHRRHRFHRSTTGHGSRQIVAESILAAVVAVAVEWV
jgi:hypothetical protein